MVDKKSLSEADICTQFVTPSIEGAGWDLRSQVRQEVTLTAGRITVRGKLTSRGQQRRADYVLYRKPNIPVAVIEAKDNNHSLGAGMPQALAYVDMLDVPFAFSTNGDGFLFHNKAAQAHGAKGGQPFFLSNRMAESLGWDIRRFRKARDLLVGFGILEFVRQASSRDRLPPIYRLRGYVQNCTP